MSAIENCIREAVEKGGYKESLEIDKIELFPEYAPGNPDFKRVARVHLNHADMDLDYSIAEILLDPSFWQALGKARGWDKEVGVSFSGWIFDPEGNSDQMLDEAFVIPQWHYNQYRFIDHLASGKSAEEFFATL